MPEDLALKYIALNEAALWDENPKLHDIGGIVQSIRRYGFKDPPKFEPTLNGGAGGIVEGNGRIRSLRMMRDQGDPMPTGLQEGDGGEWMVPVLFGVDADSELTAQAYALDHNNLTLTGGDLMPWDVGRIWDGDGYLAQLRDLQEIDALPVTIDDDSMSALIALDAQQTLAAIDVKQAIESGISGAYGLKKSGIVKMLVNVPDLGLIEQALVATNKKNRAEATSELARSYLETHGQEG